MRKNGSKNNPKGDNMKKEKKIKPLPIVKAYTDYWIRRSQRVLKVKKGQYKTVTVDYSTRGMVYVWFHGEEEILAHATFTVDGKRFS